MVKRVDIQHVAADGAGHLEEINQLAEHLLRHLGDDDAQVRHAAVFVGQHSAEFSLVVHLADALAGDVVELVEVFVLHRDAELVVRVLDRDHRLEEVAQTVLDVLSHGVEVGAEGDRSGEDALVLLAVALTVELFPPFAEIHQTRLVVHHDFVGKALGVEGLTHHGILRDRVVEGRIGLALFFHLNGTLHQGADVDACHGDGQQAHGGEHREAAAHIIGYDIGLVALHVGQLLEGAAGLVGDGNDARGGLLFAVFVDDVLLKDTEGDGWFRCRARLGDDGQRIVLLVEDGHEVVEVVLTHVMASVDDEWLLAGERCKVVLQGLDDGTGAEIGAADADDDEDVRLLAQVGSGLLDIGQQALVDFRREVHPAEEVVACASFIEDGFVNF